MKAPSTQQAEHDRDQRQSRGLRALLAEFHGGELERLVAGDEDRGGDAR